MARQLPPGSFLRGGGEVVGEGQDAVAAGGYLGVVRGQDDRAAGLAAGGGRDGEHAARTSSGGTASCSAVGSAAMSSSGRDARARATPTGRRRAPGRAPPPNRSRDAAP